MFETTKLTTCSKIAKNKTLFRLHRDIRDLRGGFYYIRKTPNVGGGIGALNAAESASASTVRVCAGSRMPSSHSRAVE
jgi:hypothetical protein